MKKSKVGIIIAISIISVIVIAIIIGTIFLIKNFKFKDLGVNYGNEVIESIKDNTGITIESPDGMSVEKYLEQLKKEGKKLGIDYTIVYSDYSVRTIELTSEQATALMNEMSPSLHFIDKAQLKFSDKKLELSASLNAKETLKTVFPKNQIPLPGSFITANFYTKGEFEIKENRLIFTPSALESGLLKFLPIDINDYISKEMTASIDGFFKNAEDLYIESGVITERDTILITGNIPTKAKIVLIED